MTDLTFIGLGNMGGPMAANLARAGYVVTGVDPAAPMPEGVAAAQTVGAAVARAEIVITMLPDGAVLRSVAAEIAGAAPKGTLFIDCSTVDVDSARAVAEQARAAGLEPIDAPVSGGTAGAAAGTLTFMVGGSAAGFARAAPLLDVMGARAVHCGESGAGQAAKICNNMMLGISMLATAEAFVLADALGLSRQALYDVASTSSGQSWSLTTYCPAPGIGPQSPADRDYAPGFAAELMLKDLDLAQKAAAASGAATPMGARAAELYARFAEVARGKDFSAVLPWLGTQRREM